MLCSVCGAKNSKFDVKCHSCLAFLQNPVRVLNLFEVLTLIFTNPRVAFHKIIISERKNYAVFLSVLFGISLTLDIFYLLRSGEKFNNLIFLLFYAFLFGFAIGVSFIFLIALILKLVLNLGGEKLKFKSVFALLSYITLPMSFSLIFLLPARLAVFGIYYFTETPKPYDLKPVPFYIFLFSDFILKFYSLALMFTAIGYITENLPKAVLFTIFTSICVVVLLNLLTEAVKFALFY